MEQKIKEYTNLKIDHTHFDICFRLGEAGMKFKRYYPEKELVKGGTHYFETPADEDLWKRSLQRAKERFCHINSKAIKEMEFENLLLFKILFTDRRELGFYDYESEIIIVERMYMNAKNEFNYAYNILFENE